MELREYSFFLARNFFNQSVLSRYWSNFERIACFERSPPTSSCYVREGVLERETFSVCGPGKAVSSTHISLRVRRNQWHARTIARPPHTSARCQHLWPSWSGLWLSIGECKGGREGTWGVGGSTTFSSLVARPRRLSSNAAWVRGYTFQQTLLFMWLHMIQQLVPEQESELLQPCMHAGWLVSFLAIFLCFYEQNNHTPRCSQKVSAAGLPWLEHFWVPL